MISDLDEPEENSERAVELFGLRDISDLGPPDLPQQAENDSFRDLGTVEVMVTTNYSGQQNVKTKPKMRARPAGLKLGGLSLDTDQINREHDDNEKKMRARKEETAV